MEGKEGNESSVIHSIPWEREVNIPCVTDKISTLKGQDSGLYSFHRAIKSKTIRILSLKQVQTLLESIPTMP